MDPCSRIAACLRSAVSTAAVALSLTGCEKTSEPPAVVTGPAQRVPVQKLTVECFQVNDGQRSWLELSVGVDGQRPLRMPVVFKQKGRPVEPSDEQARSLVDAWLTARAGEIAIFGTIGLSFGQATPAVTIDIDQPVGGGS